MLNIAIVVICYKRIDPMKRLLKSLLNAYYDNEKVDLIISIDKSDNEKCENYAKAFKWDFGEKRVVTHTTNLGLRKHILGCGEYLENYDAVVVLEDDLVVMPGFWRYVRQTSEFYNNDKNIAGVSLYSSSKNIYNLMPFSPIDTDYDIFFLQVAQSWGQVWFKEKWNEFIKWYEEHKYSKFEDVTNIPKELSLWPESSWLKYHLWYCIEKNKFFVYPYKTYTTCFSEEGEHTAKTSSLYQTNFNHSVNDRKLNLPSLDNRDAVCYDGFFENCRLSYENGNSIASDLYGIKHYYGDYKLLLSSKKLNYKLLGKYGLVLKPHEENYLYGIEGEDIYLYDLTIEQNNKYTKRRSNFTYYYKLEDKSVGFFWKAFVETLKGRIKEKICNL